MIRESLLRRDSRYTRTVEQTLSIFKVTISHNSCKTFEETKSLGLKKQWKN